MITNLTSKPILKTDTPRRESFVQEPPQQAPDALAENQFVEKAEENTHSPMTVATGTPAETAAGSTPLKLMVAQSDRNDVPLRGEEGIDNIFRTFARELIQNKKVRDGIPTAQERDRLKREIVEEARAFTKRNNFSSGEIREVLKALFPKVLRLQAYFLDPENRPKDAESELALLLGSWKSELILSKQEPRVGVIYDPNEVYQVISEPETAQDGDIEGEFYNVSNVAVAFTNGKVIPLKFKAVLKGEYKLDPAPPLGVQDSGKNNLSIEFTENRVGRGVIPDADKIQEFAENSDEMGIALPSFLSAVGIEGNLRTAYVDEDFRISIGGPLDKDGLPDVYILTRVADEA